MIILDEPDLTELKVVIDEITSDLSNDNIDMDDIVIIADGGEVLNNVLRVSSPHWPKSFHVQSFMGSEAPIVIWVSCAKGKFLEAGRQVCDLC